MNTGTDVGAKLLGDADISVKSFDRRDKLVGYELDVLKRWEDQRVFESDADPSHPGGKFLVTFPYPYMNGVLHLGHAFTLTKAEFAAGFNRLCGKKVLFPFGFHCTGMPIAAAAKNLRMEIETYGNPPVFPVEEEEVVKESAPAAKSGKKTKGKLANKKSKAKHQWQILYEMGVPEDQIASFVDPLVWLKYFPPIAMDHLKRFGLSADWRRTFITTEANPYYDAFIRWQFNTLRKKKVIEFGNRVSIFSPIDNQACADHDRSVGEQVGPQEYTCIKLRLQGEYPESMASISPDTPVYLIAATLRPETMYGQTNAWVLPRGEYGAFKMANGEVFVMSDRSALNMSYQDMTTVRGVPEKICEVSGWDLLGRPVSAPNAQFEKVYVLPLLTIKMGKGTGIVTSVPSDAPDDFIALMDVKKDEAFRAKYKLTDVMVDGFEVVPIIDIPELGTAAAASLCESMGVKNQHDRVKLDEIKDRVYKTGFAKGTMIVGNHVGTPVKDAKPIIQAELIASGEAFIYSEPESLVMSRTGAECVCALTDQWYLTYGSGKWQEVVKEHVDNTLDTYNPVTKAKFQFIVGWLKEWACSRNFGLGTKLPWDPQYVIESLSDSTIYMSYYTIAHYLQNGLEGQAGVGGIPADRLTDELFDSIFLDAPYSESCGVDRALVEKMKTEFEYWYPVDLRVSGKDLIGNHLTMCIYNHAAIWADRKEMWPRSFYTNGHALLNDKKMSKSTGNFMTLIEAIELFGSDATRFGLADAGDSLEDANFTVKTGNAAVLRLTKETEWIEEIVSSMDSLMRSDSEMNFVDRVFANDINAAIINTHHNYDRMLFREGLKTGVYDLQNSRNSYRASCLNGMNKELVMRYIEVSILIIAPICPCWAQKMWELIGKPGLVCNSAWPVADPVDPVLISVSEYLNDLARLVRLGEMSAKRSKKAAKEPVNVLQVFIAKDYKDWQKDVLQCLKASYDTTGAMPGKREVAALLKSKIKDKKTLGAAMAFTTERINKFEERGVDAIRTDAAFDEMAIVQEHLELITRGLEVTDIRILYADDESAPDPTNRRAAAVPGAPSMVYLHL